MENGKDENKELKIKKARLFFIYNISFGFLIDDNNKYKYLETLFSDSRFFSTLRTNLDNRIVNSESYDSVSSEFNHIVSHIGEVRDRGAKVIWSDYYLQNLAPIYISNKLNSTLSTEIDTQIGQFLNISKNRDNKIKFSKICTRLFPEGTISVTFEFELENQTGIFLDEFIELSTKLEKESFSGFKYRMHQLLTFFSQSNIFKNIEFLPLNSTNAKQIDEILTKYSNCHCLELLENIYNSSDTVIDLIDLKKDSAIPGILNRAPWYSKYGDGYIKYIFDKNLGYRKDEIYITDRSSTIVLLSDYWDEELTIKYYLYDLRLALELEISKYSFLVFNLFFLNSSLEYEEALSSPTTNKSIKFFKLIRGVLLKCQDTINNDAIIIHGFTRKFTRKVSNELGLDCLVQEIERRIDYLNSIVLYESSDQNAKMNILLKQKSVQIALYSIILSSLLSIIKILGDLLF